MKNYPTPHINATPEDFGKTVLMPGDPLRAKFIAENHLENAKLVNNVRGINGYTGYYNGVKISVMASGMGMPSIGIYSYELFNFFGVENIIRVGSAGAINENIKVRDIVIGMGACTNSNFAHQYHLTGSFAPICSYKLLKNCTETAEEMKLNFHVGNLLSSDTFYNDEEDILKEQNYVNGDIILGIRPEDINDNFDVNAIDSDNNISATVQVSELTGAETIIYATVEDQQFVGKIHPDADITMGQQLNLNFNLTKAHFFDPTTEARIR